MDTYSVKRLAEVLAIQAEIEGIKIHNAAMVSNGNFDNIYSLNEFYEKAEQLRVTASKHDDQL